MPSIIRDGVEIPLPEEGEEQERFTEWLIRNKDREPFHPEQHYDYVGAFREGLERGEPPEGESKGHLPDTFKLPGHPTFSVESKYYKPGMKAVRWEGDNPVPVGPEEDWGPSVIGPDGSRSEMDEELSRNVTGALMGKIMGGLRGMGSALAPGNVSRYLGQPLWGGSLKEVLTKRVDLGGEVSEEERGELEKKAYDWVEPHLFATAGLTAGVNAARRSTMLSEAVEMSGKNIPTNQIWQKTGWKKDPQGKWRFEIDDSGLGLKVNEIPKGKDVYLEEIIDHPNLFEQYPELREIKINRSSSINGYVDSNIYLKDFDKAHVIHEVQHAIQDIEGFARGGSSSKITKEMMESVGAKTPFEAYRRLYGEFDARDAVSRMNWNAEARRTVEPWSSEIKPKGGWIVR